MSNNNTPKKNGVKRRKFLKYSGIGIGLMLGGTFLARNPIRRKIFEVSETLLPPYMGNTSPLVWIQVSPANEIIIHSSKVEMGQGTFTSLAQIAAEELDLDFERIKVVHANTDSGNIDQVSTGGSTSVSSLYTPLREMAATIREMLKKKAAEKLGVGLGDLNWSPNGTISGGGKSMTLGEVVNGVTEWKIPKTPKLKDPSEFKYIGKPIARVDLEDKVYGTPIFGMDAEYPDMLYASVVRSRMIDTEMSNFDTSEAEKMPGVVKVVKEKGFVGVVAESHSQAEMARRKIKFDYTPNKTWNLEDVNKAITVGNGKKTIFQKKGKAVEDIDGEGEIFTMEFRSPIGAHAQIEPNGAVANYKDCLLYTSPSPRDATLSRMPSSA